VTLRDPSYLSMLGLAAVVEASAGPRGPRLDGFSITRYADGFLEGLGAILRGPVTRSAGLLLRPPEDPRWTRSSLWERTPPPGALQAAPFSAHLFQMFGALPPGRYTLQLAHREAPGLASEEEAFEIVSAAPPPDPRPPARRRPRPTAERVIEAIRAEREPPGRVEGPVADVLTLEDSSGLPPRTAIVFRPPFRGHPALDRALDDASEWLRAPYVNGLAELVEADAAAGRFVYGVGPCQPLAAILEVLEVPAGPRAGLELLHAAGSILVDARDAAPPEVLRCHGGLTPWRLALDAHGLPHVLGYGLPAAEILRGLEAQDDPLHPPALPCCPPERLHGEAEDLSSDLFSLSAVAFELITGRPLYDGLAMDVYRQAHRGSGRRRLFRFKDRLPLSVYELLKRSLRAARGERYPSGEAFLEAVGAALKDRALPGRTLAEVAEVAAVSRWPGFKAPTTPGPTR